MNTAAKFRIDVAINDTPDHTDTQVNKTNSTKFAAAPPEPLPREANENLTDTAPDWEMECGGEYFADKTEDEWGASDKEVRWAIHYLDPDINPRTGEVVVFLILLTILSVAFAAIGWVRFGRL